MKYYIVSPSCYTRLNGLRPAYNVYPIGPKYLNKNFYLTGHGLQAERCRPPGIRNFLIFGVQSEQTQIPIIMVNKVILIGNLGRDPEVRYLEGNVAVAKFSVATNESYKDKKGEWQTVTEWHDVVAWRALAERAEKQLKKGSQVFVEGKLTHRKYQDKDGNDKYVTEVVANHFRVLDRRDSRPGGQDEDFHPEDSIQDSTSSAGSTGEQQADDDLPF